MQIQERLIVPGLGVIVLLSAFILGVPLVYKLLLGLLGLAATATYFAPHAVQVETRIAIAALGLIILLLITSTAFWLTLLSFGAIAALQIPHRHTLQRSPATIAWLSALLERRSGAPGGGAAGADAVEGAGAVAAAGDDENPQTPAPSAVGALPAFIRMNVAGIGSSIFGVLIVVSLFVPWVFLFITYGEDETETFSYTLRGVADTVEDNNVPHTFFIILLVLGLLSMASIVLPRAVAAIVAIAGLLVTFASYFYLFGEQVLEKAAFGSLAFVPPGVGAVTFPHFGVAMSFACFFVLFILQLIPRLNRSRNRG